jgi:glucose dehydrogenase
MDLNWVAVGSLCVAATLCLGSSRITRPTDKNWDAYYGSAGNDHASDLTQINRGNISRLKEAWRFETGETGGLETTPLVVNGVLYALTPSQKVIALDGRNGRLIWTFDSGVKGTGPNRGLTFWHSGNEQRLFAGVMNFLYALDPDTGRPIASFGRDGRVDLREGLGREPALQSIALTSPGVIYKDAIIVGGRVPETMPAPSGDIRAYDVRTGAVRWTFHTIPHPGEFGYDTWPKGAWKTAGSANNWAGMAVDIDHGIVFVPTGSAVPDFYGANRQGDDLFADCLLALNAETGKRIWHFQGVHHDIWDRDFPSPPTLVTLQHDGTQIPAVVQSTKQGMLFVFNRLTGQPLFPIEERAVPQSEVPGERAAASQPFPLFPAPFSRQEVTEDTLTDRTPEAHRWAVEEFGKIRHAGPYTPLSTGVQTLVMPSFEGGGEWGGIAVEPYSGIAYVNANDYASYTSLEAHRRSGSGQSTYLEQCSECHGENRAGSPPTFPSLLDIGKTHTSAELAAIVHQGRGRMPAFPNVQETQLEKLIAYLRSGVDQETPEEHDAGLRTTNHATNAFQREPRGAEVYASRCAICHGNRLEGSGAVFPGLKGITSRMSDAGILGIVHSGSGRMPAILDISATDESDLLRFFHADAPKKASQSDDTGYVMTGYRRFLDPDGYPAVAPPWGTLSAIDLNTGKFLWQRPLGEYPALSAKGIPETGTENYGGPLVTAGGVVWIAATNFDCKFRAFDKKTGKLLWQTTLPYPGNATPATYAIDGKQYVVIASGGGALLAASRTSKGIYIAYALPDGTR